MAKALYVLNKRFVTCVVLCGWLAGWLAHSGLKVMHLPPFVFVFFLYNISCSCHSYEKVAVPLCFVFVLFCYDILCSCFNLLLGQEDRY